MIQFIGNHFIKEGEFETIEIIPKVNLDGSSRSEEEIVQKIIERYGIERDLCYTRMVYGYHVLVPNV